MGRTQIDGDFIRDDSVTGDDILEESLILNKIPFSSPHFDSDNARDAIEEAWHNFLGWTYIPLDTEIEIYTHRQMNIKGGLEIDGCLKIGGNLVVG